MRVHELAKKIKVSSKDLIGELKKQGVKVKSHMELLDADVAASAAGDQDKKIRFEFDAFDKNGKKIVGTIVSEDPLKAYARLFDEYSLNVVSLFSAALSEQDKEQARKIGIESLRKQYEKIFFRLDGYSHLKLYTRFSECYHPLQLHHTAIRKQE